MIPIIVLIPGFAGNLKGRKATAERAATRESAPVESVSASDGDRVLPHTAPYTRHEANLIYCAAINVAQAMTNARGLEADHEDPLWLIEAVNGRAMHFGKKNGHAAATLIGAMEVIEASVRENPLRAKDPLHYGWRIADAENFERMLSLMFVVSTAHAEIEAQRASEAAPETITGSVGSVAVPMPSGSDWVVELDRISDPVALLKFATDLGGKTWATGDTVRQFIWQVCSAKGWNLYQKSEPAA